jgi:tetratricopeptide (TPR) repeat protein
MLQSFDDLEISLLNSKWTKSSNLSDNVSSLLENVCSGNYKDALNSEIAKELLLLQSDATAVDSETSLASLFRFVIPSLFEVKEIEIVRLSVAVACLHAFLQENWTGPTVDIQPSSILSTSINDENLNTKSITELAFGGEPAYHLTKLPILLRLSQLLLDLPYQTLITTRWWHRRVVTVHQLVLDEPVPFEVPKLKEVFDIALKTSPDLAGQIILEEGLINHHLGLDKEAFECFIRAADIMGLEYEVTGALGVKTKYQDNPLSQLVLLARSRDRGVKNSSEAEADTTTNHVDGATLTVPETLPLNDDTLLEEIRFSKPSTDSSGRLSDLDPSNQPALHPLDQCVFLGMCLNVRNTSPAHGLTSEQMMPYVSRVISHPKNWSIHTMALLLRSRLEANRTRTIERSTLQLQQLVEQMPSNDSPAKERLLHFHTLPLPSKWQLERELALRFMSLGVTKSALEIFERLEMWEEVVKCWGSMERPDKGILIIQDLLAGRKQESEVATYRSKSSTPKEHLRRFDSAREAKLRCLLGDLEPENAEEHYEKAWKVSGESSGRAIRSLGGYHFARNNFKEAIRCLKLAVSINPLLLRSWFILGCAYVREERWKEARDAFARCVAIDDEDAESWNNLASVYLRLGFQDKEEEDKELVR